MDNNNAYPMRVSTNKNGSLEYVEGGNAFRHFQCLSNELINPKVLACPSDDRQPATSFRRLNNYNLSYFVGVDANDTQPQMLLAGDRNLMVNGAPTTEGLVSVKPTDSLECSIGVLDLFDSHHPEFGTNSIEGVPSETPRTVYLQMTYQF